MCGEYEETVDHLFLYCPIAREIWFASMDGIRMDSYQPQSVIRMMVVCSL